MISMRIADRAIPVAWKVVATRGPIGFDVQELLLDAVLKMIPEDSTIFLAGDRFYGTSALIAWCQRNHWQYRLRLKGNLVLEHAGGEITTGEAAKRGISSLENAQLSTTDVATHIGILHEKGHPEPWIIAMDAQPSPYKVLDYGLRWGIECMFSDFKSRGFSITKTHLRHGDRIERLILILTIALYWAVSTGMQPSQKKDIHSEKNVQIHDFPLHTRTPFPPQRRTLLTPYP